MGFSLPDYLTAQSNGAVQQSQVDTTDFLAISSGIAGTAGVVSGCMISPQASPNLTVQMTSGVAVVPNVSSTTITSVASLTIVSNSSGNPRVDLVGLVGTTGTAVPTVIEGTPAANPLPPTPPTYFTLLARIDVLSGATTITSPFVTDKRVAPAAPYSAYSLAQSALPLNGSSPMTGTLQMGSNPITGVSELSVSGITGATQSSRYVGSTVSGAPVTGSFSTGDFIIDRSGSVWVCTSSGSPGTWIRTGAVTSYNGRTGSVVPQLSDIGFVMTGIGQIPYSTAAGTAQLLSPGNVGTVITSNGSSSPPSYQPPAYSFISRTTLSSTSSSLEIYPPSGFTHLKIYGIFQSTIASGENYDQLQVIFNGDSTDDYSVITSYTSGGYAYGGSLSNLTSMRCYFVNDLASSNGSTVGSGYASTYEFNIFNYSSTTWYKNLTASIATPYNNTTGQGSNGPISLTGTWAQSSAITSITFLTESSSPFPSGCSVTLYGLA